MALVPLLAAGLFAVLGAALAVAVLRSRDRLRTESDDARRDRERAERFVRAVLSQVDVGIVACDERGIITVVNQAARDMLGGSPPEGPPGSWIDSMGAARRPGSIGPIEAMPLYRALQGEEVDDVEFPISLSDGERVLLVNAQPLLDPDGRPAGAVAALHDVTARKAAEAEMRRLAMQDHLTGLGNRRQLAADLRTALAAQAAGGPPVTLLLMDLDRFKQVNDTAGHHRGDRMLVDIAERLRAVVHAGDLAARIGGDEFVVLCAHCAAEDDALALASAIQAAVDPVLGVEGGDVRAGMSVGVVRPGEGADVDDVLRYADLAMYEAKSRPGTSVHVYEPELGRRAAGQHALHTALRRAVRDGDLAVAYQPIVDTATQAVVAAEALVRWQQGDRLRSPAEFLPLAETSDLIIAIDLWMLRQACAAVVVEGAPPRMNVNLSARTLALAGLAGEVEAALEAAGARPDQLCLELTETALIGASSATDASLAQLADAGVGIALDDFGTGYASLDHLRRFPVDTVKIDRSFVRQMVESVEDHEIVSGTLHLARRLGLVTVAEGVERPAQAAALAELGCDRLQGYLLGRPTSLQALVAALARRQLTRDLGAGSPRSRVSPSTG